MKLGLIGKFSLSVILVYIALGILGGTGLAFQDAYLVQNE